MADLIDDIKARMQREQASVGPETGSPGSRLPEPATATSPVPIEGSSSPPTPAEAENSTAPAAATAPDKNIVAAEEDDVAERIKHLKKGLTGVWGTKVFWLAALTLLPVAVSFKLGRGIELAWAHIIYVVYHVIGLYLWMELRSLIRDVYTDEERKVQLPKLTRLYNAQHKLGYIVVTMLLVTGLLLLRIPKSNGDHLAVPAPTWLKVFLSIDAGQADRAGDTPATRQSSDRKLPPALTGKDEGQIDISADSVRALTVFEPPYGLAYLRATTDIQSFRALPHFNWQIHVGSADKASERISGDMQEAYKIVVGNGRSERAKIVDVKIVRVDYKKADRAVVIWRPKGTERLPRVDITLAPDREEYPILDAASVVSLEAHDNAVLLVNIIDGVPGLYTLKATARMVSSSGAEHTVETAPFSLYVLDPSKTVAFVGPTIGSDLATRTLALDESVYASLVQATVQRGLDLISSTESDLRRDIGLDDQAFAARILSEGKKKTSGR